MISSGKAFQSLTHFMEIDYKIMLNLNAPSKLYARCKFLSLATVRRALYGTLKLVVVFYLGLVSLMCSHCLVVLSKYT